MVFAVMRKGERMSLINREALIAEYDRAHVKEPEAARRLIVDAPTVADGEEEEIEKRCYELKCHAEYLAKENARLRGQIKALAFAVRCNGVSGNEVQYEVD